VLSLGTAGSWMKHNTSDRGQEGTLSHHSSKLNRILAILVRDSQSKRFARYPPHSIKRHPGVHASLGTLNRTGFLRIGDRRRTGPGVLGKGTGDETIFTCTSASEDSQSVSRSRLHTQDHRKCGMASAPANEGPARPINKMVEPPRLTPTAHVDDGVVWQ